MEALPPDMRYQAEFGRFFGLQILCDIFGVGGGNLAIGKELFRVNCLVVRSGGGLALCCDGNLDAGDNS